MNTDSVEVAVRHQRCRRRCLAEKVERVRHTYEPGMSVSLLARQGGIAPQPAVQLALAKFRKTSENPLAGKTAGVAGSVPGASATRASNSSSSTRNSSLARGAPGHTWMPAP